MSAAANMLCLSIALQMIFVLRLSLGALTGGYITLKNLGCWRDSAYHLVPALEGRSRYLDGNYARRRDAIQKCARAAWERGYRAFVLQNGGWCGSSSNAIFKYSQLGKAQECGSSGTGGFRANQVYQVKSYSQHHAGRGPSRLRPSFVFEDGSSVTTKENTTEDGFYEFILSDLGCWTSPPRGVRSMEGLLDQLDGHYRNRVKAITKCAKGLADAGYETMAMHDGGRCMVVDDIEVVVTATISRPSCTRTGKGTRSSIQVYEIRYSDTRYIPPALPTSPATTSASTATTTSAPTTTRRTPPWVVDPVVVTFDLGRGSVVRPLTLRPRTISLYKPTTQEPITIRRVVPTVREFITQRRPVPTTRQPATSQRLVPTMRLPVTAQRVTSSSHTPTAESSEYFHLTDLGCWRYVWNDSLPSLEGTTNTLDGHYSLRNDAIKKCAKTASQLGYEVFAIQDGGKCVSSQDARRNFAKYGQSSFCRQDGRGGSWVNQVYEVNVIWDVRISGLGCYSSGDPNILQSLEGASSILDGEFYQRSDAIRKCANVAASRGFEVFALHDDGECLSSANARSIHMTHGVSNQCPLNGRGGFEANDVYEIIAADKIRLRNLGCWRDTSTRAVPGLEQTDAELMDNFRTRKDALAKCARVAWRTGLKVFVLQSGGWCGGSVLAEITFMKYGRSTACKPDGEGGHKASHVYEIIDE